MTVNKNQKQRKMSSEKSPAKRPGTRMGTIEDWRAGGTRSLDKRPKRGQVLRDGR